MGQCVNVGGVGGWGNNRGGEWGMGECWPRAVIAGVKGVVGCASRQAAMGGGDQAASGVRVSRTERSSPVKCVVCV